MINGILAKSYADAWKAKEEGRPVGWSTSVFPQELVEVFGLDVLYPENQAAGVAAKKESLSLCEAAEVLDIQLIYVHMQEQILDF